MSDTNPLFPQPSSRSALDAEVGDILNAALSALPGRSLMPTATSERFRDRLATMDFAQPMAFRDAVEWLVAGMSEGMVQMAHPGYLGLFNPKPSYTAEVGDRIAAAFNPQNCVWSHAPFPVDIEEHVIDALGMRFGLPDTRGGHFTSGGSEANHSAFLCALTRREPHFAEEGSTAFAGKPRIYISNESHLAWLKIAHECGVGRSSISRIATDGHGRMDASALRRAIESDVAAGRVPVMVAATAGTTNAGMVDPLNACHEIAREFGLWLHVDAAWGGAAIVSGQHAHVLDGISNADSITVDAHKWLATTMGAGMILVRDRGVLPKVFNVNASYMPSNDEAVDLYVNSMQWSRRFIGVRLFLSLLVGGWAAFEHHIDKGVALMDQFAAALVARGWRQANQSRLAVGCFVPPNGAPPIDEIVAALLARGNFWCSVAVYEGQRVLRACITNHDTQWTHLEKLLEQLDEIGNRG